MSSINSEYTQLINQFKNEIGKISLETLNKLKQSVSDLESTQNITKDFINDFENQINSILYDAQNQLINKQNDFYNIINSMSVSISSETEEIKNIIEQKKQEALLQLNKSENSAINRLEETYDIGVETILSAEKTALHNLGILTDKLIEQLKEVANSVDVTIKNKLNEALNQIEELTNTAKEEIKEIEIQIKEDIKDEADKLIAEVYEELENIKIDMRNFAVLLKKELTEHKDLLIGEIKQDKEQFFIEMDREKNRILEVLRLKEYEIIINLNNKEQAIISNIAMVVAGYDRELEILKQSKLNEFIDALELIADKTITNIVINAEEVFKTQIDRIIKEVEDTIMSDTIEAVRKLLNEFSEQRYEIVLPAGKTIIELPRKEATITNRLKLYLDGILQVREKHYIVDTVKRTIILSESFSHDIDVIVTEDIPDQNIETQIQAGIEELKAKANEFLKQLTDLKNNYLQEIDSLRIELLKQINNSTEQSLSEINSAKDNSIEEIINSKENSLKEINIKVNEWLEDTRLAIDKISESYKKDFKNYCEQYMENVYTTRVAKNQSLILIPPLKLVLNKSAKVYFDGILQILDTHYTIDFLNNSITILNTFEHAIDLMILQNLSVANLPKREATNEEIDSLFVNPYRLGTDKDVDSLYKKATNKDIDSLFK